MYPDERRILMTPGPVVFSIDTFRYMLSTIYEHTSLDFAAVHGEAIRKFRRVVGARDGMPTFIIPGSGSLAMEASLVNTVKPGSRVLVVSHGYFGDRWAKIASSNSYDVRVLDAEPGEVVGEDVIVRELSKSRYEAILVNHVETSTGVRADVEGIARVARKFDSLLIVDGVSSVAAEPLECFNWGVDVVLTASQKALEAPPGLALISLCTEKAVEAYNEVSGGVKGFYLRLSEWEKVMRAYEEGRVAYYATPATHLVVALEKSLDKILREGLENRFKRHSALAKAVRAGLKAMGLKLVARGEEIASNTVTAAYTPPGVSPSELRSKMMARNVVTAMPLHPALRDKSFRIGHMGSVNANDVISAIAALERALKSLGVKIELGSGLKAVQETLADLNL